MKYTTGKRVGAFLLAAVMVLLMCPVVGAEEERPDPNVCPFCGVALADLEYQVWDETTVFEENTLEEDNHYRLEADVTLAAYITVSTGANLILDLNGHSLTAGELERCFAVYGTMTLQDSSEAKTGTLIGGNVGKDKRRGGTVYVAEDGGFTMLGGTLIGGTATQGGNLYGANKSRYIYIYGGNVLDGTAVSTASQMGRGGNIYALCDVLITGDTVVRDGYAQYQHDSSGRGGNIFIHGADLEISGNAKVVGGYAASRGGNILINAYSSLTVRDNAVIYGGTAKNYGNNLDIMTSTFNMEGGTIYGNPAGGCKTNISMYSKSSAINISGGKIYGYFAALAEIPINISGNPYVEHLYLPAGALITPGQFENTAWIGLEVAAEDKAFTGPMEDPSCYIYFFPYNKEGLTWYRRKSDNALYLTTGKSCQCCGEDANDITWIPITDGMVMEGNADDRVATHYRLEGNLVCTQRIDVNGASKPITVDLNGYVLTAAPGLAAFSVKDNTTLNIVDNTADKEGKIVGGGERNNSGGVLYVSGSTKTLNLYGGTISGGKIVGSGHYGGGVYIDSAIFNMYGGTISGNTAEGHGGNMFVSGTGKFNMYGGTISDGIADGGGGGNIYVTSAYAHVYIYDGLITGGKSVTYTGGNIMVNSGANLHIYGGTIEYGAALKWGGNIYVGSSRTFTDGTKKYSSCEIFGGIFGAEDDSLGKVNNLDRGSSSNPFVIYNATIHNQTPSAFVAGCSCYATVDGITTIWNYGHGGSCNSDCAFENAWGKVQVKELTTGSHEFKVIGDSCLCSICKYTYIGDLAATADGKIYADLQEALLNAPLDSTVTMMADATLTDVVVSELTLDLNGHTLTADSFTSALSGNVIDSSRLSAGKLVAESVTFAETNASLPITLADGIHFCDVDFKQWLERVDEETAKVKFYFTQRAAETIIDDAIQNGSTELNVQINLTWKDSTGKKQNKTFSFGAEFLQKYAEKWNGRVFVTTINGVDKITDLKCTYQVTTQAGSDTKVVATTLNNVAYIKDKLSWETINSYPIKNSAMTVDEMRDLVVSFMEYTKTYLWTPDQTVNYIRNASGSKDSMKQGTVYGGLPYVGVASGNVYRMMDYIDPVTGLLDMQKALPGLATKDQLAMSDLKYFGSQCSISVYWAWGRLINSANYQWTYNTVPKNGFILLGDMQIPDIDKWTASYNTTMACHENGEQLTYSNYAAGKKADVLVYYIESSGGDGAGHLMMLYEDAHVEYNADGTINGEKSYLTIIDQGQSWKNNTNAAGDSFSHKGNIALKKTFKAMYDYGYVAFTYAEFVSGDPLEQTQVSLENGETTYVSGTIDENTGIYNSTQTVDTLTREELFNSTITANYGIADAYIILYNAYGEEIYRHAVRVGQAGRTSLKLVESGAMVTTWEYGTVFPGRTYQMKIEVQLATGERPVIFEGNLIA